MYQEFKEQYFNMRSEILVSVRAPRLVMSRVTEGELPDCIDWLKLVKESPQYRDAMQRYREVDDDKYLRYKFKGMMDYPEIKLRKKAFRELNALWTTTIPAILRRANAKA